MKLQRKLATPRTAFGKFIDNTYGKTGELHRVNMNGYVR
jgi:hypothetical protein